MGHLSVTREFISIVRTSQQRSVVRVRCHYRRIHNRKSKTGKMTSQIFVRHKSLYKHQNIPWKVAYRQRCVDRLKESRQKQLLHHRKMSTDVCDDVKDENSASSSIEDLMKMELQQLKQQQPDVSLNDQEVDAEITFFEQIRAELLLEEQQILAEYDEHLMEHLLEDSVLCPVCKSNSLLMNKSVLMCKCGLRVDTEQDCITLSNVKDNLERVTREHSDLCAHNPHFGVVNTGGILQLLITCQYCDKLDIVV